METQLRYVSKEEAHKLIDEMPEDGVMLLTYNKSVGLSDNGKFIRKNKSKKFISKAETIILSVSEPISTLDLHNCVFDILGRNRENIIKTILLTNIKPKLLEWPKLYTNICSIFCIDTNVRLDYNHNQLVKLRNKKSQST